MGNAASSLSLTSSGQSNAIEGNICITATEVTAVFVLPPIIEKLRRMEPGINVELIASNRERNLIQSRPEPGIVRIRACQQIERPLGARTVFLLESPAAVTCS
ncbi:MAG: hypothetical protein ACC642_11385 [Pseudomonadales bacterium]